MDSDAVDLSSLSEVENRAECANISTVSKADIDVLQSINEAWKRVFAEEFRI